MDDIFEFSTAERAETLRLYGELKDRVGDSLHDDDEKKLRQHIGRLMENHQLQRDVFGLNPVLTGLQTAVLLVDETGLKRDAVLAILLRYSVESGLMTIADVENDYGQSVAHIMHGLRRIQELYQKTPVVESENFRNLLLSFAEDMRVILIMIADRVNLMRQIRDTENTEAQHDVSQEAAYLYAPLAHKLGLYKLKSELEDLSLKYLEHDAYYLIRNKLSETKQSRDAYIERFIKPISEKLDAAGIKFHIKGRTKSIHSIWQKMKKQKCGFEGVFDLFAIRIILDSPLEKEKMQCWQTYSIITERMDEVAERGVAAHWRYKGIEGQGGMDEWLTSIRQMLETSDGMEAMDQFRMDLYEDEVYVFTPRGDLLKFPKGATVLDMAYHIHSKIGSTCVGARVNNKVVTFRYLLQSGDQVEIMTATNQKPKQEWLSIVKTSRAKAKIRLALKETQQKDGLFAKEMIERKFKNRKIEFEESIMQQLVKKLGFKEVSDFYREVADGSIDMNLLIDKYLEIQQGTHAVSGDRAQTARSADEFVLDEQKAARQLPQMDDVLVIDRNLKGLDYQLARCCNPIYGDDVFGFVTVSGGIKIHRTDCPNAPELKRRFGYRVVRAKWSGKGASQYSITLRVIGVDDIGIVNNLTNIISKEEKLILRSINIDSHDGLFRGNLEVMIDDQSRLESLIKRLRTVKGVKQVDRI